MLEIGLTGGIGSGKSTIAHELASLGAHVIDSDQLARDVVAPGTEGLAQVVASFGPEMLFEDGNLDRAKLGRRVFSKPEDLATLNGIIHPLVRQRSEEKVRALPPGAVVVHDVPLLVEKHMAKLYDLVMVVSASRATRQKRLLDSRALSLEDIERRMAAQATDEARREVADIWLNNDGDPTATTHVLRQVWHERLAPYAVNLANERPASHSGLLNLLRSQQNGRNWHIKATQMANRIGYRLGIREGDICHIGATAVPGLDAEDVVELQLGVATRREAESVTASLASAGYPLVADAEGGAACEDFERWWSTHAQTVGSGRDGFERVHASADPGQNALVYVRQISSARWAYPLLMRDWLRADPRARDDFSRVRARWAGASVSRETFAAQCAAYLDGVTPAALAWAEQNWRLPAPGSN